MVPHHVPLPTPPRHFMPFYIIEHVMIQIYGPEHPTMPRFYVCMKLHET